MIREMNDAQQCMDGRIAVQANEIDRRGAWVDRWMDGCVDVWMNMTDG